AASARLQLALALLPREYRMFIVLGWEAWKHANARLKARVDQWWRQEIWFEQLAQLAGQPGSFLHPIPAASRRRRRGSTIVLRTEYALTLQCVRKARKTNPKVRKVASRGAALAVDFPAPDRVPACWWREKLGDCKTAQEVALTIVAYRHNLAPSSVR